MSQPPGNSSAPTAYSSENRHSSETIGYKPDEANNVWEKTNRLNEVTRITYDKANRPTKVDYLKDGSAETFGYDPAGNLNAAANNTVAYGFQYDRLNRLIQKADGRGRSLSFSFDKAGTILTKTTYQGSATYFPGEIGCPGQRKDEDVKELRDFMEGIAARNGQGAQRFRTRS